MLPSFSPPAHVTKTALLGGRVAQPLPSRHRLRASPVFDAPIFATIVAVARIPLDCLQRSTALVVFANEYEPIALDSGGKVAARGRTHRTIYRHTFWLSGHYDHSSSTPGRRSRMIVGVQLKEIGKGYYYYGSEVGRLCSTFSILSRFTTMMYRHTGVAEGPYLGGHPCLQRCTRFTALSTPSRRVACKRPATQATMWIKAACGCLGDWDQPSTQGCGIEA